jgi:hypothetical protein
VDKDLLAALATLVASFAGAWAAFALEGQRRSREKQEREVAAGNRAIYTVYGMWNVLEQYRKEVIEPFRKRDDAWLNLAAQPAPPAQAERFQVSDLQLLIDKGHAPVFATLLLEQQRYDLAIGLIRSRSDLVLAEVFPKLSAARVEVGQSRDQKAVEEILGIDVCHRLRQTTAAIIANVDQDLASLREAYTLLRDTLKTVYPKQKFLEIIFEDTPKNGNVAA